MNSCTDLSRRVEVRVELDRATPGCLEVEQQWLLWILGREANIELEAASGPVISTPIIYLACYWTFGGFLPVNPPKEND